MDQKKKELSVKKNWWSEKSQTEKILLLLCILLLIITLALLIPIIVMSLEKKNWITYATNSRNVCSTPGCIHAASSLLNNIDITEDPCTDFYKFSCGKYLRDAIIPEDKTSIDSVSTTLDTVSQQLKLLMEEPLEEKLTKPYRLIKQLYDICMNTTAIELDGLSTIKTIIKELGGWPLLDNNWNEKMFDWKNTMYNLRKYGFEHNHFIGVYVCVDEKNSSRSTICIAEGKLSLNRKFLVKGINDRFVKAYYDYIVDIAEYFGANRSLAIKELRDTIAFELKLAQVILPQENRRNSTALYQPIKISELQKEAPVIPWLEYITNILDIPDIEITEEDTAVVAVPDYFKKLDIILAQTPKRVLANHIMLKLVTSSIYYLNDQLRNRHQQYKKILIGSSERESRWKECIRMATDSLYLASAATYVKRYFDTDTKRYAEEIVTNVQNTVINSLQSLDWMDPETKSKAVEKAESIVKYIAFPDELLDKEKVEKFYANLEINTNNLLKASNNINVFYEKFFNNRLRELVNKTEWIAHAYAPAVNAYYNPTQNSIEFPAGILQGVFFDADRPRYLNYGSLGYIVGHEIIHGFDDVGRQYDKDGNLNNWWNNDTEASFIKKAQCILNQYGNYTVSEIEMNLNSKTGQGENIADNDGIKQAYLAYQNWVKNNGPEPHLPGLSYTPNQLFWVSAANTMCIKYRKEYLKYSVSIGNHSPNKFRINGPLSNSEDFANDFKCPLGSNMNPFEKCVVW